MGTFVKCLKVGTLGSLPSLLSPEVVCLVVSDTRPSHSAASPPSVHRLPAASRARPSSPFSAPHRPKSTCSLPLRAEEAGAEAPVALVEGARLPPYLPGSFHTPPTVPPCCTGPDLKPSNACSAPSRNWTSRDPPVPPSVVVAVVAAASVVAVSLSSSTELSRMRSVWCPPPPRTAAVSAWQSPRLASRAPLRRASSNSSHSSNSSSRHGYSL